MIKIIETPTDQSNYEFISTLDGVDFVFRLLWNARAGRWFMTLRSTDGSDLITGRKVCANIPWAGHIVIGGRPDGQLWIYDSSAEDPGLRDLGERSILIYVEEDNVV